MSWSQSTEGGTAGSSAAGGEWVDDGESSSSPWAAYGDRYGSSSGSLPSSVSIGSFLSSYNDTDRALAWLRLVLGSAFIVLGTCSLVWFHRSRWVLDIRTRSARLVILGGIAMMLSFSSTINTACMILWDKGVSWFWVSLLLFAVTPLFMGSYVSRAVRLAVVFHPRAKRALPWLIPERNYLYVLACLGIAAPAIPIYFDYTLENTWEIISKETDILAVQSIVLACVLASLYPFIRKVDDIFSISRELTIVTVAILAFAVGGKVVTTYGGDTVIRWLGPTNANFFITVFIFGVSVMDPLRRMACDPLAASKGNLSDRVLLTRRENRSTARTVSTASTDRSARVSENEDETRAATFSSRMEERDSGGSAIGGGSIRILGGRRTSARARVGPSCAQRIPTAPSDTLNGVIHEDQFNSSSSQYYIRNRGVRRDGYAGHAWNFERLASTPLLAAAFEEFSRKALCHESVLFLSAVCRYESFDFSTYSPAGSSATSEDFMPPSGVTVAGSSVTQFDAFTSLANTFIKAGAREEVNLGYDDRKRIMSWVHGGREAFNQYLEEDRRLVFGQAYREVRSMLEQNLLLRFLSTDEFKQVLARRERITAMMDSPEPDTVH